MVDDDVALLRVVREALVATLNCEVDTSPKPEYAFELALKKKYDLFIFDFQMPMIDGAMKPPLQIREIMRTGMDAAAQRHARVAARKVHLDRERAA